MTLNAVPAYSSSFIAFMNPSRMPKILLYYLFELQHNHDGSSYSTLERVGDMVLHKLLVRQEIRGRKG
jgi:hypothetical protein